MKKSKLIDWRIVSAIIWLLFTVSLASWWLALGLQYSTGKKSMIIGEGLTLILFIASGGIALIYYILEEKKRNYQLNQFFASANHELKTYMASLRLRAEGLSEDLAGKEQAKDAAKIVSDTIRLELQLENSLIFSEPKNRQVFLESIDLREYLESLSEQWMNIKISIKGEFKLRADRRMIDVIIKNLIQNAIIHAKASEIIFELQDRGLVVVTNLGKPFIGELPRLGELFYRHQHKSRSGIGLYLVKTLSEALGGKVAFSLSRDKTLKVELEFINE
jgi:signal transduction histidine kinase